MRIAAAVLGHALAAQAFAASAPNVPPQPRPDQVHATGDSAFVRQLLRQPLAPDAPQAREAVKLLHYSGNGRDSQMLQDALNRRLLSLLTGEEWQPVATIGEAIEREAASREPLAAAAQRALDKIEVRHAAAQPGAVEETRESPTFARVTVPLRVRNGLASPLGNLGLYYGQRARDQPDYFFALSCKPAAPIAPGATATVPCTGANDPATMRPGIEALRRRSVPEPLPVYSFQAAHADVIHTSVYAKDHRLGDDDTGILARLAQAPCQDKGTCAEVARAESHAWRRANTAPLFGALALGALVVAALAAARARPRNAAAGAMSILAGAVAFCAIVGALSGYWILHPAASYEGLVLALALYYAAVPFVLAVCALLAGLASGHVTRLRVFAGTFGSLVATLVAGFLAYST